MRTTNISRLASVWALSILIILASLTGTSNAAQTSDWSRDDAAHLLRRAGFGGTPQQIDRMHDLGRANAVEYLVSGKLPEGATAPFAHVELPPFKLSDDGLDPRLNPERLFEMEKLRAWWLDRMVRTDRPLEEKMTLFWHGLFTSGIKETKVARWMVDQNLLFHREAIGNYKTLTREILHDPAMLKYLNNDENLIGKPNENLARELMELFTMGEGNGYDEADIPQVARALTGMSPRPPRSGMSGSMLRPLMHDSGRKTIFGKSGNFGPDDVVRLIFDKPEPANYLAKRLWTYFGQPDPTETQVRSVAEALLKNGWDVAPALRTLFNDPSFYSPKAKLTIIKSPVELVVSTLRLLEEPAEPRLLMVAINQSKQLGQELLQPPNVKGWPGGEHWITSSAIYQRYNISVAMANGQLGQGIGNGMAALRGKEPNAGNGNKAALRQIGRGQLQNGAAAQQDEPAQKREDAQISSSPAQQEENKKVDRKANQQVLNQQARMKVQEELRALPALPPPTEMVVPAKLFPQLAASDTTADQMVDAAAARFLQQPLSADKKAVLVESLGSAPIRLGQFDSDRRVRQMIGLMMSTPEYQVE
ncbi:MAG TPA: DUF1800 domain-containing protein [Humisphaera sp.]|nr:DUF1800 domain-containing protein [Humisphaera sp.]